ncbi:MULTISPECIES: hypothetical protein [Legionella]|uniref:Uncharacterized protein n=1 Tax=Legionella resiliens TaxID=2905958 RepID=A0ABS8X034_9GAMM|nr:MULTISPECIES: hypothetical protein [unclassified Legionella]MCE0722930.1 hypothetical protein [Legionella sp. 9fVS26]MCE3532083.1 hypothetical protein [Legionella sp. 8cVS16]QLZ68209.1 hypothetical protein FOLKNPGA_00987 [Legionella sp. PC1000]
MGKKDKQKTSIEKGNNFGIPTGLVAQRRAELIAAKERSRLSAISLNTTYLDTIPLNANGIPHNPPIPLNPTSINAIPPGKASLTHVTKSRPKIEHRNPSRPQRKSNSFPQDFFKKNEPKHSESIDADLTKDWLNVLKKTIGNAQIAYKKYYELGINTRQPNGWFSWWRHGPDGQKKAELVKAEAEASPNIDAIMQQMQRFFEDPDTRCENHSFASYLFAEFNCLVQGDEYKPQEETIYDKEYWYTVAKQLRLLMDKEEYAHGPSLPGL